LNQSKLTIDQLSVLLLIFDCTTSMQNLKRLLNVFY